MSDNLNPYQSPLETEPEPFGNEALTFGATLRRGVQLAHRTPSGIVWMFFLLAPIQIVGLAINAVMLNGDFFERLQRGNMGGNSGQMPPELLGFISAMCSICLWLPLMLFVMPWVWGGVVGQMRSRLETGKPGSFAAHGKQLYVSMLLLLLLFLGVVFVASIPNGIVNQLVTASQHPMGRPLSGEQLRSIARHPANIISGLVTGCLMCLVGLTSNLIACAIAARRKGIGDGIGRGLAFVSKRKGEFAKLVLLSYALFLPSVGIQYLMQLNTATVMLGAILGVATSLYMGYLSNIYFGMTSSLYAARSQVQP